MLGFGYSEITLVSVPVLNGSCDLDGGTLQLLGC